MSDRFTIRLFSLFGILNGLIIIFKPRLLDIGAHIYVLMIGNLALAIISLVSYLMSRRGLASSNHNAFIRAVYGSTLSKLMLCVAGIATYVLIYRPNVSKLTIFMLLFLYLVYTVFETLSLFRLTRLKK
ncbi:hypothetical protein [Chitinophaga nivalis]|uniref:ATP synthase subunit I n=1 Tax=Chitinophaga nivalis TaxID=2991709 RepID=A0ABT3IS25_9BACT|nr:hypothetical protein [Chitinophaga nivalis]MCW3463570.1 hypothetical protein [Chitinophaga nivalis]MCW3486740.1 hypothetical protein [Chitinophaga nivalis]